MADNTKPSEDASVATKDQGGNHHQKVLAEFSVGGTPTLVSSGDPLPVSDASAKALLEAIGALLTTIDADTGNLSTILSRLTEIEEDTDRLAAIEISVGLLDNAISGSEMQVDVVGALPAGNNNIGDVDVASLPELPAGTKAIGKLAANSGVDIGDVDVTSLTGGTIAHDAADSGNPIKVGARAVTALIAAVANNDRADLTTDKFARLLATVAPLDQRTSGKANFVNTTAADIIAAPGAGTALVITGIKVINSHATVGTKVEILNDSTQIDIGGAGPNYGGWVVSDPNGLFPPLATNKALRAKCLTSGADVDVTAYGYKVPA